MSSEVNLNCPRATIMANHLLSPGHTKPSRTGGWFQRGIKQQFSRRLVRAWTDVIVVSAAALGSSEESACPAGCVVEVG